MVTLSQVANGHPVVVRMLALADPGQARQLEAFGILPGRILVVERAAPFGGPVMVRVGEARYALGRMVCDQILVEPQAS
jgi:Fe2+ transport system protein FeoA